MADPVMVATATDVAKNCISFDQIYEKSKMTATIDFTKKKVGEKSQKKLSNLNLVNLNFKF